MIVLLVSVSWMVLLVSVSCMISFIMMFLSMPVTIYLAVSGMLIFQSFYFIISCFYMHFLNEIYLNSIPNRVLLFLPMRNAFYVYNISFSLLR